MIMRLEGRVCEKAPVVLVLSWIVLLHLWCFYSAGALWRDESNSILQARLPRWEMIWASLEFDSFPILYPAALRLWSALPLGCGDLSLRLFGLCTGLVVLASIWVIGRLTSGHVPLICFALVAADPVLISEGDSIRPYGISMLCLLWAFGFFTRYVSRPSALSLSYAALASVLAVQASYINALFIGVFCMCAALIAARRDTRSDNWKVFLPGLAAAVSLLPYTKTLRNGSTWASLLHSRIDWYSFLQRYLKAHSPVYLTIWLVSVLFIVFMIFKGRRDQRGRQGPRSTTTAYTILTAVVCAIVLTLFVEATGVPPFPRYFLPGAILLALALESVIADVRPGAKGIVTVAALLVAAVPTWNWLSQRHTNMDRVTAVIEQSARPGDLIVISPWFLHTSFQRYYGGAVEWCTVPDLDRYPMMRYDLVKNAIIRGGSQEKVSQRLHAALDRGGAVWFIAQRAWVQLDRHEAPEPLPRVSVPRGQDYVSFRSYWERDIEFRLRACCQGVEAGLPHRGQAWEEEDLILTRWSAGAR